jgi:glutaredoxin
MNLILYSASFCPTCPKIGKYLESRGIRYEERDVEKYRDDCDRYEIQSLPTVRIGEQVLAVGNDTRKLERFLRTNGLLD